MILYSLRRPALSCHPRLSPGWRCRYRSSLRGPAEQEDGAVPRERGTSLARRRRVHRVPQVHRGGERSVHAVPGSHVEVLVGARPTIRREHDLEPIFANVRLDVAGGGVQLRHGRRWPEAAVRLPLADVDVGAAREVEQGRVPHLHVGGTISSSALFGPPFAPHPRFTGSLQPCTGLRRVK